MADPFAFLRLRVAARDAADLERRLLRDTVPAWANAGLGCWGVWRGLFGIASNELLVMVTGTTTGAGMSARGVADAGGLPDAARPALPGDVAVVDSAALQATVRPASSAPLTEPGLYVFRFFEVRPRDCDEIVALSRQAWQTFETAADYASRPMGLFRPDGESGRAWVRMLLVTWYDGFASWETSRTPAPAARENFRRRHALTGGTVAYATRLVLPG